MYKDKLSLADIAIELDLEADIVLNHYKDYLKLVRTNGFMVIYEEVKGDFPTIIHLYRRIKKEKLTIQDITNLFQNQQKLKDMEKRVELYIQHIQGQQFQIRQQEQIIDALKSRIDNYDGVYPL
jgi:hypothetical protein